MIRRLHDERVFTAIELNHMHQPIEKFVADVKIAMLVEASKFLTCNCKVELCWRMKVGIQTGINERHGSTRVIDDLADRAKFEDLILILDGDVET